MPIFNFPTILTLIRLALSPLILPFLFVYLLPLNNFVINIVLAFVFIVFSLTDFFDGYLARKYDQETALGKVLDPIADKFLIYSVLISLLAVHKIFFFWVVVLIGREFFLMGLRQIALENNFCVHVSYIGKLKTTFQMIYLTFIIINPYQSLGIGLHGNARWNGLEFFLMMCTIALSVFSAWLYYRSFIAEFMAKNSSSKEGVI